MAKKDVPSPSAQSLDRVPGLSGPGHWGIWGIHSGLTVNAAKLEEALSAGWEPFAVDVGVVYLRRWRT